MPTCSQAKIITNLESSDLNRRLFSLVIDEDSTTTNSNGNNNVANNNKKTQLRQPQQNQQLITKSESNHDIAATAHRHQPESTLSAFDLVGVVDDTSSKPLKSQLKKLNQNVVFAKRNDYVGHKNRLAVVRTAVEGGGGSQQQQVAVAPRMQRRITINELPHNSHHVQLATSTRESNFQLLRLHKVPIVFGEVAQPIRTSMISTSSKYATRQQQQQSFLNNQMRINMLRSELNMNLSQQQRLACLFGTKQQLWCTNTANCGDEEYENELQTPISSSSSSSSPSAAMASMSSGSDVSSNSSSSREHRGGGGGRRGNKVSISRSQKQSMIVKALAAATTNTNTTNATETIASQPNRKQSIDYSQCLPIRYK